VWKSRAWKQGQVGPGVGFLEKELVGRGKGRGGEGGRKRERENQSPRMDSTHFMVSSSHLRTLRIHAYYTDRTLSAYLSLGPRPKCTYLSHRT
jgi:hypothetical protein